MLEIAGGILLAIVILIFVLANFGWIIVGLSALATLGMAVGTIVLLVALPADARNAILIVAGGCAAVVAFGYWSHFDKRFLLPDDKPGKDEAN
jgi:hypothetical protein